MKYQREISLNPYIVIVLNFLRISFFDGRLGQFGEIRVEYNQGGHLNF
jgi:hypothetical protein